MKTLRILFIALISVSGAIAQGIKTPTLLGSLPRDDPRTAGQDVVVRGDYAYIAAAGGLYVVDIREPSAPVIVGQYNTASTATAVSLDGNYAYISRMGGAGAESFEIIDITDPAAPKRRGFQRSDGHYAWGIAISNNIAYLANADGGLRIFNVSNPAQPRQLGAVSLAGASGVAVSHNYAYVAGSGYFQIIDVSNPARPVRMGQIAVAGIGGLDVAISGNYAYVACFDKGLYIIDVSKPAAPVRVGTFLGAREAYKVVVAGKYAFVTNRGGGLKIIDVGRPSAPVLASSYQNSDFPFNWSLGVDVRDNLAFLAGDLGLMMEIVQLPASIASPALKISRTDGETVLSWPLWGEGFFPDGSVVGPNPTWNSLPGEPMTDGDRYVFTNRSISAGMLYRLRRP